MRCAMLALLVATTLVAHGSRAQMRAPDRVRAWLKETSVRLGSPDGPLSAGAQAALAAIVGSAQVVGVGESRHHTHELTLVRLQLLRALVERHEATALAMETGLAEARRLDAWLRGAVSGPPDFTAALPYADDGIYEETQATLRWLRDWNAARPAARRVRFYGVDLSYGGGSFAEPLEGVWQYLDDVDPAAARTSRERLRPVVQAFGTGYSGSAPRRFAALNATEQDDLARGLDDLRRSFAANADGFAARTSPTRYDDALRLLEVANQTLAFVRSSPVAPDAPRDRALAENLLWVLGREKGRGAVVLFAHNAHVQKAPIDIPGVTTGGAAVSMGSRLQQALGNRYVAIGTTFDREDGGGAASPDSVDGVLASACAPSVLLDLHAAADESVRAWLDAVHPTRFETLYLHVSPARAFDALVFVDRVGPGRRVP